MSSQPTVLTVVGARPQFIQAAPVSRALAEAGRIAGLLANAIELGFESG